MEADVRKPYCPPAGESEKARTVSAEPSETAQAQGDKGRAPPHFEGFQRATQLIGEYKEYASYYMATKIDGIKSSVRNIGIYAGLGIAGLIAFSALITTAVALFLVGAAMGLAHIFEPPKYWLGALIVGLAVLVLIGVGAGIGLAKANAGFRKATVDKYEQRKRWQRGQFGRDVEQAAAAKKEK
jgi:Putative Actinobacterial Holin-X, holin superfamily III